MGRPTIRVERPRDQRFTAPPVPGAVRSNGWLDGPRPDSGQTALPLWSLERYPNLESLHLKAHIACKQGGRHHQRQASGPAVERAST